MTGKDPVAELHPQFSSDDAIPTAWAVARERLEQAEVFWLSTVRPDGRPHVTPLLAVWLSGALYFCTGEEERKARNLAHNAHCVLTTGCNALNAGLDLVVEGDAVRVSDAARLQRIADIDRPLTLEQMAAMILVEECRLRLDEPVDRLLPELADRTVLKRLDGPLDDTVPAKRPIT